MALEKNCGTSSAIISNALGIKKQNHWRGRTLEESACDTYTCIMVLLALKMQLIQKTESLKEKERLSNNNNNNKNHQWVKTHTTILDSCNYLWPADGHEAGRYQLGKTCQETYKSSQTEVLWSTSEAYLTALLFCACSTRNTRSDFLHYFPWPRRVAWIINLKSFERSNWCLV